MMHSRTNDKTAIFHFYCLSYAKLKMEAAQKILDNPAAEIGTAAIGAVSDAITTIPDHLSGQVDATSTDAGTTIHIGSHNATTVTGKPSEMTKLENQTDATTDDYYSCAYTFGAEQENISKLVRLETVQWNASQQAGTVLKRIDLPKAFWQDDSYPAYGQAQYFGLVRTGFHFQLMVSAPIGYAGCLGIFYVPRDLVPRIGRQGELWDRYGLDFHTILNLPYALANVADNTEVALTVPYISAKNYAYVTVKGQAKPEAGAIYIVVFAELENPTNANNTLEATLYGSMVDLDFQAPRKHGYEDTSIIPDLLVEQGRSKVKKVRHTLPPEPPIQNRQIIQPGPGSWNAANSTIVAATESMAIANESTAIDAATAGVACAESDLVSILQRWSIWKSFEWNGSSGAGTQVFKQAVDWNFGNFSKISECFQYFRGSIEVKIMVFCPKSSQGRIQVSWFPISNNFTLQEARNAVYTVMDVSGPSPVLVMPFTSDTWRRQFTNYGWFAVHVVNAFRSNAAAANKCRVTLLVRAGQDFKLYVPKRPATNFDVPSVNDGEFRNEGVTEGVDNPTEPQIFLNFDTVDVDITSQSHSLLKNLFGRPWFQAEYGPNTAATKVAMSLPNNSLAGLTHAYLYWSGEFTITILTQRDPVIFAHTYEPGPDTLPIEDLMSMGAVFIPRYAMKSIRVPFYSREPLRCTYDLDALGYVYINAPSKVYLFISMTGANFFFKCPLPKRKNRAVLGTHLDLHIKTHAEAIKEALSLGFEDQADHKQLLLSGDIEENPGPQLVYRDRGLYKHYGVRVGQHVFHTATENLARSMVNGSVDVIQTEMNDTWKTAGPEVITMAEKYLKTGMLPNFRYSLTQNCESWARDMVDGDATSYQGNAVKMTLAMAVCLGFFTACHMYEPQSGIFSSVTTFFSRVTHLIYGGFECFIVKTVVKTVVKIICYLILYAHCPNLLTTGVLAALLAIDCLNTELDATTRKLVDALVEGRFSSIARALLNIAEVDEPVPDGLDAPNMPTMEDQGPKDFNDWSNVAKNTKWWFENLTSAFTWIKNKIFPPDIAEAIDELEEKKDEIAATFAVTDEHICMMMTDKTYSISAEAREKHIRLVDMMSGILDFLSSCPKVGALYNRASSLMHRLQQLNFEPTLDWMCRPEPVGIWISGSAGVGKSFLVKRIANEVAKHFGWRIYSNPTGSNHMDGYTDQQIHLFDDFGQSRDEDDYNLICQLISSCPFIVPKADVSAKGTPYNARLVLITTNRHDFSSQKLFDPEALRRRFPIILHIRPKEEVSVNGRISIPLALQKGSLVSGSCWQRDLRAGTAIATSPSWADLNLDVLIKEVIEEIETRAKVCNLMNQGKFDDWKERAKETFSGAKQKVEKAVEKKIRKDLFVSFEQPDSFFDCEKIGRTVKCAAINLPSQTKWEKCKFLVTEYINKLKNYLEKHRAWIMAIGALGSVISIASLIIPWGRKTREESLYDGAHPVRLTRDFARIAERHVSRPLQNQGKMDFSIITRRLVEVQDDEGYTATALALGSKDVVTYGHDSYSQVLVGEDKYPVAKSFGVTINEEPMDLQLMVADMPKQFKKAEHLIYDQDYEGHGFLLWKKGNTNYVQPVSYIKPYHGVRTINGSLTTYAYSYEVKTTVGTCGGVLVAPIGGNLKILGIHVAGNGATGISARLFKFFVDQGKVTSMQCFEKPLYHQPRRTAFHKSPFFQNPAVEPAVLSKNDKRLEVEIDDITVEAAKKYKGNTFDPPMPCFLAAKAHVQKMLRRAVRKSTSISYDAAVSGEQIPIDWTTSPGHKYPGLKKRDLIVNPKFRADVEEQLANPGTYFTTYLKDELRPQQKVRLGKTRAIEACNFDFVIAYRMVLGKVYQQIYDDLDCRSGIAVGICPYLHWGSMLEHHHKNALALDFSGFDGSLPPELLEAGVEILASFHDDPKLVKDLHRPIIYSTHLVSNQVWEVEGGMCSGAPCTSVLNSICNNIAAVTVALSCGANLEDLHVVSYGDDILLTSRLQFPVENVQKYYSIFFGMTATSAKKTDEIQWEPLENATFLKRKTGWVDFFPMPVGVLDLQSMLDHIQWTRGFFDQQLESFCFELVFHGPEVYRSVTHHLARLDPSVPIPSYSEMRDRVRSLMINQGKPSGWGAEDSLLASDLAAAEGPLDGLDFENALQLALHQDKIYEEKLDGEKTTDFAHMVALPDIIEQRERQSTQPLGHEVWKAHMLINESKSHLVDGQYTIGPFFRDSIPTVSDQEDKSLQALKLYARAKRNNLQDDLEQWKLWDAVDEHIAVHSQGDLRHHDLLEEIQDAAWVQEPDL
nr:MAG: polyprotein [Picornaviridae sp.]